VDAPRTTSSPTEETEQEELSMRRKKHVLALMAVTGLALALLGAAPADGRTEARAAQPSASTSRPADLTLPGGFKRLVVIYEENHSFDNLYGGWGRVAGQHLVGLNDAPQARERQVAQDGSAYDCLLQNDKNLMSEPLGPLPSTCHDPAHNVPDSAFTNQPFSIDDYIKPDDKTCPAPGAAGNVLKDSPGAQPGGCTRDLVHRFYQEQYQLNGGRMNRYVTGSDAEGLTMGTYATKQLPVYRYLHRRGAPHYVIADKFFQAAFGGSFLNHQWLIAARTPFDSSSGASGALNSILDANGMPISYPPLYTATGTVQDKELTQACPDPTKNDYEAACGDFAVNTIQPSSWPYQVAKPGSPPLARLPLIDDSEYPNIGDRLTDAGISWKWYSGGWDAANAVSQDTPGNLATEVPLFQTHHQPFNYFADYAPGKPGRRHLQDETDFIAAARAGKLPRVSFVKPYGAENEHPGYASESQGSDHLVDLLRDVMRGDPQGRTLVVVTYDEFGGQWDHVPPPGMGTAGAHDAWGPGTRIPALLVSNGFRRSGVDHTPYDTTSILATIERSFDLRPLSTRDADVNDLAPAVTDGHPR
jgi:acid phosphatase